MINQFKSWFTIDKRILGIYRIFFGILIFVDILRRWEVRHIFYSNNGIVHHYKSSYFSLLNMFDFQLWMIDLFFIIGMISSILLILGYKTKLSHLISAIILISLHNKVILVENAGDFVMNCMIIWTFFLPLGSAISLDSLKLSLKNLNDSNVTDLNHKIKSPDYQYCSIAYFAILLQISAIYFFTGLNKTGSDWMSGTAVHYMYQLDTFLTPFGAFFRDYVGATFSTFATYGALGLELSIPLLLLFPLYTRYLRLIAVLSLTLFHLIIMSSLSIGLFSQTMIVSFILLLDGRLIDSIKSYFSNKNLSKYILFYDSDCGFCHYTARIIRRLDVLNRITFENQNFKGSKPENFNQLIKETAIIYCPKTNKLWTKHLAFAKIASLIPLGFIITWIFYVPGLTILFEKIYDKIAINRTQVSTFFGFSACGIDNLKTKTVTFVNDNQIRYSINFRKIIYLLNSIIVFILILASINYNLAANKSVNKYMEDYGFEKFNHIKPLKKIISYPRMIQRWNMFSPSVLKRDKWLIVEATLSDGSTVDPFTGKSPVLNSIAYEILWKDINQFWRKYFTRIEKKTSQINKFKKWLLNPKNNYFSNKINESQIKSVNLWFLTQLNGPPNTNKNYKVTKKELPLKKRNSNMKKRISKGNKEKKAEKINILDIIKKNNQKNKE